MFKTNWQGTFPAYALALAVLIADQVTKMIFEWSMVEPGTRISLVETFELFRFTYVHNPGAAWGILRGFQPLFVIVALVVSGVCVWAIQSQPYDPGRFAWSCVLGGGLGNMIDRIFTSVGVVDFLDVGIYGYRWPTFNIADSALTVGMVWLGYQILFVEGFAEFGEAEESESTNE